MKIVEEREWDGGIEGKEITIELPHHDRLEVRVLDEEGEVACELTLQDSQGRAEISIINGSATFYT